MWAHVLCRTWESLKKILSSAIHTAVIVKWWSITDSCARHTARGISGIETRTASSHRRFSFTEMFRWFQSWPLVLVTERPMLTGDDRIAVTCERDTRIMRLVDFRNYNAKRFKVGSQLMRHALYFRRLLHRVAIWVRIRLYKDFRWTTDGQVSVPSLPDKSGIQSPTWRDGKFSCCGQDLNQDSRIGAHGVTIDAFSDCATTRSMAAHTEM